MAVRAETDITLTRVDDGAAGSNGATFTPSVDVDGDISWTNDAGLPNPPTQNIMGPAGSSGISVTSVKTQYYLSTSDSSPTGGSWSDTPQAFVSGNYYWTRDYIDYSDGTHDTSTPVYNQGLTLANVYAMSASDAADNASEYAARALGNLSTVQSVTETLNWIAQHGTMALTTDVALDPTHVYFVVDAGGDYVVGGVTYAVVTEPDVADIGTYYELTIDESLNNYVGTHLALTSEGLWLLPAASGTNKVLIAHGNGSVYTTAGTYIIDSNDVTVASFTENGAELFTDNSSVALFSDTVRIGKNEDGNAKLLASPNGLDVITDDQAIAFSVTTSDKIDTVKTYVCPSVEPILPNEATTITLINGYDSIATGTQITYRVWRTIYYAYNQVNSMYGRTAKSKTYYDFVFTKGTSSSATKTFSFVKQNAADETDTQSLSVSISYNSSNGTITITAPNYYYYPDIIPTTPGTAVYYNVLSTETAYAETQKYIAATTIQGTTDIFGLIHTDIPEYTTGINSNSQVFGAVVTGSTTSANVMTMTATAKGDPNDVFSLSSSPLPRVYVYTGLYWTDSSITGLYLNINGTGAIPVYSNGQIVSGTNDPWKTIGYIGIYYDGSKYVVFYNKSAGSDVDGELAYAIARAGLYDDVIV